MELTQTFPSWLMMFEIGTEKQQDAAVDHATKKEKVLICAHCQAPVTRDSARIEINGGHRHSFFNPHGIIFQIGCFDEAPGCKPVSVASAEFSWFPGYNWRIVACANCNEHLGWDFNTSGLTVFYGLILDRLVTGSD